MSELEKNSNVLMLQVKRDQENRRLTQAQKSVQMRLEEAERDIDRLIQLVMDLIANCEDMQDKQNTLVRTLFRKHRPTRD